MPSFPGLSGTAGGGVVVEVDEPTPVGNPAGRRIAIRG